MATNLNELTVSLTKHGAHKLAFLIEKFEPNDIINHLAGDYRDIRLHLAQTRVNLSLDSNNIAPKIWDEVKKYEREDIFDLTFIAIVFSHNKLIKALAQGFRDNCTIVRGKVITGKEYTNFAHTIEELGFSIVHTSEFITFDISRIFYKFYLIELIKELLSIKLIQVGWNQSNSITDECLKFKLNNTFGLSSEAFTEWMNVGAFQEIEIKPIHKATRNFGTGLKFSEGHNPKMENDLIAKPKNERQKITLLHNKIQTRVYNPAIQRE